MYLCRHLNWSRSLVNYMYLCWHLNWSRSVVSYMYICRHLNRSRSVVSYMYLCCLTSNLTFRQSSINLLCIELSMLSFKLEQLCFSVRQSTIKLHQVCIELSVLTPGEPYQPNTYLTCTGSVLSCLCWHLNWTRSVVSYLCWPLVSCVRVSSVNRSVVRHLWFWHLQVKCISVSPAKNMYFSSTSLWWVIYADIQLEQAL